MDEQRMKVTYTRDFGTYIGRLRPMAHGISGSVSDFFTTLVCRKQTTLPLYLLPSILILAIVECYHIVLGFGIE